MAILAVEFVVVVAPPAGGDASGCVITGCSGASGGGEGNWGLEMKVPKLASPNVLLEKIQLFSFSSSSPSNDRCQVASSLARSEKGPT